MGFVYETIARPVLFAFDAEASHAFSIAALKVGFPPRFDAAKHPSLCVHLAGLNFPNPLGMAAGYDKNADVPDALLSMGFGHTEVGTVTPLSQAGNPKPRIFRLRKDEGIINRLGFNSGGHEVVRKRLAARNAKPGIVGVNLGANKTSEDFAADYVTGISAFGSLADYFTINISSPNTPGLRALQGSTPLADLLNQVSAARAELVAQHGRIPLFLKIAPDLSDTELDDVAKAVQASDIDAVIVSNTTFSRNGLTDTKLADETGGLSGRPLFERSTIMLAKIYQRLGKNFPLIGVGGIYDADSAFTKLEAGASLVQLYSALVYKGPELPGKIINGLAERLKREGLHNVSQISGRASDEWAKRSPD